MSWHNIILLVILHHTLKCWRIQIKWKKILQSAITATNPQRSQSVVSPTVWVHFSECVKTKDATKLLYRKLEVKTTWQYYFSLLPKLAMYKSSTWTRWILELMNTWLLVWCSLAITIVSRHLFRLLKVRTQVCAYIDEKYIWSSWFFSLKGLNLMNHWICMLFPTWLLCFHDFISISFYIWQNTITD